MPEESEACYVTTAKQFLRGLRTCERQGGWGKAFWWVRMTAFCVFEYQREKPEWRLAA